ncbi:hypothetical protein ALC56_08945, partial [Trachymyrmex septentrionalis]
IGDTVKRFYGAELCQSSRRTATRASSTFWITPANSTRDSQRNSGTGIQDIQSCCKEEQLLWSKSLSPSSSTLLLVVLLLWTNPREFTRSRRYPKYRRNNPPFRFNLLHFARIPRRTVMTHNIDAVEMGVAKKDRSNICRLKMRPFGRNNEMSRFSFVLKGKKFREETA